MTMLSKKLYLQETRIRRWPIDCRGLGYLLVLILMVGSACTVREKPLDFGPGEKECDHCSMNIHDMRFRGEIISPKGKLHFFDSIECLYAWSGKWPKKVHAAWVGDFMQKGKWVELSKASIMHSKKMKSPMGAGLSAYETPEHLKEAIKVFDGRSLTEAQLKTHVAEWAKGLGHKHK